MSLTSREKILNRLHQNTRVANENATPGISFFKKDDRPLFEIFQEKLIEVKGELIFCSNMKDFQLAFQKLIEHKKFHNIYCAEANILKNLHYNFAASLENNTDAAITGCEFLVAQTGSVLVSTAQTRSRRTFVYPPVHMVLAYRNQLVANVDDALVNCEKKYKQQLPSQITVITGPSRTADIEKTLVLGAHGPKELIIFYLDVDFVE